MASDRYPSRLPGMLELPMAAALSHEEPAVVAKPGEYVANLHRRRNLTPPAAEHGLRIAPEAPRARWSTDQICCRALAAPTHAPVLRWLPQVRLVELAYDGDPVGHRFPLYNRAFMQHRQQEREFGVSPWLTHVRFVSAVALNPERAAGDRGLPMPVGATKPAAGSKQNHRPVRGKLPINSLQCSTMTDDRATRERAAERRMVVDAY